MNAVVHLATLLPPSGIRRLAALRVSRFEPNEPPSHDRRDLAIDEARTAVAARWGGDLCGMLNAMTRGELAAVAAALRIPPTSVAVSPALRLALWEVGAALERGTALVSAALQPRPVVLGGHLVVEGAARGLYPASARWPRETPSPASPCPPTDEPDSLDELLRAADRAIGVRLGARGADKGAWGQRAAALLGVVERRAAEPDWRGDVEIKTVAVAREPASGRWRIVDDPAIAMVGEPALAKLARTLWLARADVGDGDATIVAWYLLDCDAEVARMVRRYLHVRPKGPAGTDARGLYLHKRFFADAGLLAALNGPQP
ncbi:MAG: hypothetical protein NT062_14980 [Proteobacteria bacterium]|nr:hypothetical protein [Pseudomonadota bacterium]